ncbi:SusC/RagA family TonB-linked outer membrane protein [Chitinophaga cymbidii]|uniref:SusC/RagA family TonB-linked outer membrane protein n=1 Tax=Chitinophaga cymbidii TaxID=1096750 RepID=A0A512RLX2_9BACT|nr:TonB-dependent receptor [Chitinophaga cymbidii]GEP96708.1 SusC/RagA family TonB-linked outer membrane protein [Chitinophaga cymbidii]
MPLTSGATRIFPPASGHGSRIIFRDVTISGTVTDESGTPLPGVGVRQKGGQIATVTGADGKYSIRLPENAGTLVFSFIGYASQEVALGNGTTVNVTMTAQETSLNAVVVVGYGTQKRERVTTAIASVKSENFVKGAVTDAAQLIRGKVAGLNVVTTDANPTSTAQINLRGITTILSGTSPLVLIDGVPGTLTTVAPEDIESIDVLKDGSAAAIYGTRGTNGVILITTKKGRVASAPTIDVNTYFTTQHITRRLDFMDAGQYRQLVAQGKPGAYDYGANTNWLDEVTQRPFSQVYNVSLKGGSQNTSYIVNLNYRKTEGLIRKSNNNILYPRIEVNHKMFDGKLKLSANLGGYQQQFFSGSDGGSYRGDVYRNGLTYNPTDPVRDADGNWTEHTDKTDYANPVSLLEETQGLNQNSNLRTIGTITYTPVKNLDIMLLGSRDLYNSVRGYYETKRHYSTLHDGRNGYASRGTTRTEENLLELTANYDKRIGDHDFTVLGGYSWRQTNYQDYWMQNWDFPTDDFSYNNMGAGLALKRGEAPQNSYQSENKLIGFFFRLNYSYKNRYLLMASIRREGSSKFGANNKYGNFPAISLGWNIANEAFMENATFVSALKLRGGFGITGTEPIDPYMSLNRLNFDTYTLIDGQWIQTINPSTNANPDLRWEKKEETNIGLDYGFLDNRITGSIDLYKRTTRDLLLDYTVPTPPYLYNTIRANAASMENKGIEFQVNVAAIDQKDFQWNTSLNFSTNKNKLLSLSDKNFQLASGYFDAGTTGEPIQQAISRVQIGQPIGNFWGFRSVDIDDDGHWIIEGKDGNPKPIADQQADDKQIIGNGLPKHYLSWNNTLNYKNFDLNITMRGAFGFQILNTARMFYDAPVMLTRGNLLSTAYDNVYGKRPLADDQSLNYVSYYIEDGDYWKIDNITLGYNFTLGKMAIKALRVYASGSNLITFTGYKGIDPEVRVVGLTPGLDDKNRYPSTTTYTLGASFTF